MDKTGKIILMCYTLLAAFAYGAEEEHIPIPPNDLQNYSEAISSFEEALNSFDEENKKTVIQKSAASFAALKSSLKNEHPALAASADELEAATLTELAILQYKAENYTAAEALFLKVAEEHAGSILAGDAWFWASRSAEKLGRDSAVIKERRKKTFENTPISPYAAEAYFTYYSYTEYLQGDRQPIKHLQQFAKLYPNSPFLIEARYLIGLDFKRDRKTAEGKWIRKRSLTEAIDAFQDAETIYERMSAMNQIGPDKQNFYATVRNRAVFERALANLNIAEESQGAKQQIYLEYAESVFKELLADFEKSSSTDSSPSIEEETLYWLAQTYLKGNEDEKAEAIFTKMLEKYNGEGIDRGYYLSKVWEGMGIVAYNQKNFTAALERFKNAEESTKGTRLLSTDERLDLGIRIGGCLRGLKQYDQAILVFSKVVNDQAISSLRMKAMYLRAETYEEQGRPELARKQLESIAKKGGVWSKLAQEKLNKVTP